MSVGTLFVNKKWKGTDVYDILSRIQYRVVIDENLDQLDFKTNGMGFCYIRSQDLGECRRLLAKAHNVSECKAFIEMNSKKPEFFSSLQEFASIELKIQVMPVENSNELTQYLERLLFIETQNDNNPFIRPASINNGHIEFINLLKLIPKVGDKGAQSLAKSFKNIKVLSTATLDELTACAGANIAKSVYSYFH